MFNPFGGGAEPDYSGLPGFNTKKSEFYGRRVSDSLQDDLDLESEFRANEESTRRRTDSYINAYRLAADRRSQSGYLTPKPPSTNVGSEIGKTALSAATTAAVTAGFALI